MFDFPVAVNLDSEGSDIPFDMSSVDTMMAGAISCSVSPDDSMAALSSTDGAVRVITMAGKYKLRLQQKSSAVSLAFSRDSLSLVSAGYRTIYVWSTSDGSCRLVSFLF